MSYWAPDNQVMAGNGLAGKGVSVAKNDPVGDNARRGAVKNRSQVQNPITQNWTKRNGDDGRFMDQKQDGEPFKGVRKEKSK